MSKNDQQISKELQLDLNKLEDEKDQLEIYLRQVQKEENKRDIDSQKEYLQLDYMREMCSGSRILLQLIDEKQAMMNSARQRRMEFMEEAGYEVRKKQKSLEAEQEDVYEKILRLEEEE